MGVRIVEAESLSARVFLLGRLFSQPESLQSRGLLSNNLCLDFVVHAEIVIFPCSLLQPRLHSRILATSSHGSPFFWQSRADLSPLRPLRFSPPPLSNRSALNRAVFSRTARPSASYCSIAFLPSRTRSSFLKRASARFFRASFEFVTISPLRRVCSDTTPFIAVLIEAATGADMRPHSVDPRCIYARNDKNKAPRI